MSRLILVPCGKCAWEDEKRLTGWSDIDLHKDGLKEARRTGKALKKAGITLDKAYTSSLKRARISLDEILDAMDCGKPEIVHDWRLNPRHLGALEGQKEDELREQFGDRIVDGWTSGTSRPPRLSAQDARRTSISLDTDNDLPRAETGPEAEERICRYFEEVIRPDLEAGDNVLVVGHEKILASLEDYLSRLQKEQQKRTKAQVYSFEGDLPLHHCFLSETPEDFAFVSPQKAKKARRHA